MDRIMRARPSSSMVVALIALFVALVGTASAVDGPLPGQNQVGSADIINNEVQTADIKDANLTTVDIRSNAVTTGKIGDGEVRTADVLDDSLTPRTSRMSASCKRTPRGSSTRTPVVAATASRCSRSEGWA